MWVLHRSVDRATCLLHAKERLEGLIAKAKVVATHDKHHKQRSNEAHLTEHVVRLGVQQAHGVGEARSKESRVASMNPSSGGTVELGEEKENKGEGSELEEAGVRTDGTSQRSIVATFIGTDDAALKALHNDVRRQEAVEPSKQGRVYERSLHKKNQIHTGESTKRGMAMEFGWKVRWH